MPMKYYEQIKNQEIPPMDTGDVPAFLVDIVISEDTEKPITSGLFRLEKGESLTYTYTYHEMKLIVDGTLIIEDETGQKKTGKVGDLFYFNKGTTVTFTTPEFRRVGRAASGSNRKMDVVTCGRRFVDKFLQSSRNSKTNYGTGTSRGIRKNAAHHRCQETA